MKITSCSLVILACSIAGVAHAEDIDPASTPNWYVSLNALALNRSTPDGGAIVSSNPPGFPFLSPGDLDFDMGPGIDASLGYNFLANETLEARLMYSKFEGETNFVSPGNFIGVGFTGPSGTSFVSEFETSFASAELNWRHSYSDHLQVLVGLRAMELNDTFRTVLNANVATGLYEADNSLFGAQIGAQFSLLEASNPLQLLLTGKLGAYSNDSSAGTKDFSGNNFITGFQSSETKVSYAAEIGVTAEYELSQSLVLTAGYQAIWASNLALASNAASGSQLNPSLLNSTIFRDDIWLHGASVGMRMSF